MRLLNDSPFFMVIGDSTEPIEVREDERSTVMSSGARVGFALEFCS